MKMGEAEKIAVETAGKDIETSGLKLPEPSMVRFKPPFEHRNTFLTDKNGLGGIDFKV